MRAAEHHPGMTAARGTIPVTMSALPLRLRHAMQLRGWDQTALAKESGVAQGQISALLRHERLKGMWAQTVVRLADALEVRPAWLLVGEEPMMASGVILRIEPGAEELGARTRRELKPRKPRKRKLSDDKLKRTD